jgi:hypothetical protein
MARLIPFAGQELSQPLLGVMPPRNSKGSRFKPQPRFLHRLYNMLSEFPVRRRVLIAAALLDRCKREASHGS